MQVQSLGWEDPLEKGRTTHSSILAWRIPWREEPGRLSSIGSQRVGHNWSSLTPRRLAYHQADWSVCCEYSHFLSAMELTGKIITPGPKSLTHGSWAQPVLGSLCCTFAGRMMEEAVLGRDIGHRTSSFSTPHLTGTNPCKVGTGRWD